MKHVNATRWKAAVSKQTDPYSEECYRYAEAWAALMEKGMENGAKLSDIAEDTSHAADTTGITGFMYGCAVSLLSLGWVHGEELRQWHNLATQIENEGEVANEKGTVLNPALLIYMDNEKETAKSQPQESQ